MIGIIDEDVFLTEEFKELEEVPESLKELSYKKYIPIISTEDFFKMKIKPRELLLNPWLPTQGIAMIHAVAGAGKTHFTLGVAWAIASGGEFLGWEAVRAAKTLYIDGEMSAIAMQERLAATVSMRPSDSHLSNLMIITPDLTPDSILDLSKSDGQEFIKQAILEHKFEVIVIDNVSALMPGIKENEADSWNAIQTWELQIRKIGCSIIRVQHTGKNGSSRGSSKHMDIVDTVINLTKPEDYNSTQGVRFEVNYPKHRGFFGEDAAAFEAMLTKDMNNNPIWTTRSLEQSTYDKVVSLIREGIKQVDIAKELNINPSTVNRHVKKAEAEGVLVTKRSFSEKYRK